MKTNFLVLDSSGIACRVSSVADDWTCTLVPLDGSKPRTAPANALRPLKTGEAADAARDAAHAVKDWRAVESCEVAIRLIGMEAAGFIPAWHSRTTLGAIFGESSPYAPEAA